MGIQNNSSLQAEAKKVAMSQALIKSANEIPALTLVGEVGQLNSAYTDNRFGISQNISFPLVNAKKKQWLQNQATSSQLYYKMSENELKRAITQTYFDLGIVLEKEKVYQKSDSIYGAFLTKAKLRLQLGETNVAEKASAQLYKSKIEKELRVIQVEKVQLVQLLQFLLQSEVAYVPQKKELKITLLPTSDFASKNLYLDLVEQEKITNTSALAVEKAQLLPEVSLGYFSTTMKGNGADNNFYGSGSRFHSVQLNLGIPVFTGANKARREALQINKDYLEKKGAVQKQQLQNQYANFYTKYENDKLSLDNYEKQALPDADAISKTANSQFFNGEINFLEWAVLTGQVIEAKIDYLNLLKSANDNIIQILYYQQ